MNVVPGGPGSSGGSSTSSRSSRHKSPSSSGSQSQPHRHHHHHHHRQHRQHTSHQHRVYHNVEHANEMIVIDYADGNVSSSQRHVAAGSGGGSMGPPPLPPPNSNHAPPLPPIKRQPINLHDLQSSLSSGGNGMNNVEVNLARYANQYQHYYHAHHSHNHGPETVVDGTVIHPRHASSARQYALPGDTHNAYYHTHHHAHGGHPHGQLYKPANRSSHSSDTSSAYSGSDTMQSIHSSLENEAVVDLSGLHESVVDSDEEELADGMGQMVIRDLVRECLEKDPADRTAKDIEVLLEFSKTLEAFNNMTLATRRALCSVMVFAVVEKAGTVVMNHEEELDSWSVIINGEVRIDDPNPGSNNNHALNNHTTSTFPNQNQSQTNNTNNNNNNQQHHPNVTRSRSNNHGKYLKIGDSFGITATMDKLYHQGVMKTCMDDCQFVCITQNDYYKILKEEATNQRRYEENGQIVLVTDPDPNEKLSHKVIRGTPDRLLLQLIDENSSANESTYVEDFLLTHRTFLNSSMEVAHKLLEWFNEGTLCDRVTRVLLLWVHNHFTDFETDPQMMEFLEKFEVALESRKKMNGQLRLLNFACAEKARKRIITLRRSSREEPLQFLLMGGYERGFGIFVERVEKNSKAAEIGLKRGDQILDVNRKSFENNMSLPRALTFLKESTHLELTVKSNLLVFKELLQTPENSPRSRLRKASDQTGGRSNSEYTVNSKSKRAHDDSSGSLKSNSSSSSLPINAMRGRDRVKAMLKSLIKPKMGFPGAMYPESDVANLGIVSDHSNDSWDFTSDLPDHSLKIYRADQHFRYLLVHKNTSAREVVMLALQEFSISDCSSNFTLCEVTVEGNLVRQKRLPDEQTNLAERIGLASRYYIKNILSSEQLIPEDAKAELNKEAQVNLLQLNAIEAAMQLMVEDFTIFRSIESTEHVDKLFELDSKFGTPNLDRFGDLVNREMMWVITEIVSESNVNRRVKIIKQFIKVAHNCFKETQNYNSMFAITSGLDHGAVKRLKSTWEKVPSKYLKLLEEMRMVMEPSMNFRRYRNLVNSSKPPIIPIYPMVSKDLTFLHLGNETHIDGLINFEKLRMIAEKIRDLSNMCSTPLDVTSMLDKQGSQLGTALGNMVPAQGGATIKRGTRGKSKEALNARKMYEEAQMVRRVKAYLTKMPVIRDEERLHQLSVEVEPPPSNPHPSLAVPSSSAVSGGSIKALSAQNSTASINSMGNKPRRNHSPTPSIGSTNSSTSHQSYNSEGRKSTASGTKFGTDSPQAVRKLMALSDPSKTRRHQPKHSVSSLQSLGSPGNSPPSLRKAGAARAQERFGSSDPTGSTKLSLTAEDSSVTSLPALRKAANSVASMGPSERRTHGNLRIGPHSIPRARVGRTLSRQMENPNTKPDVKKQMDEFLPFATRELSILKQGLEDLAESQGELAEFFCEDPATFKLEECFRLLGSFCNKFKKAIADNQSRRDQEAQAKLRKAQRESEELRRVGSSPATMNNMSGDNKINDEDLEEEDQEVMKNLMSDIQSGFIQRRLPDGGFKQQYSPMVMRKFRRSVDNGGSMGGEDSPSTPPANVGLNSPRLSRKFRGGSLSGPSLPDSLNAEVPNSPGFRRRRSRIPSEEDDKLFNFLSKGGHDGSRERNTSAGNLAVESQYGSLDRGLLRRSRGRKRTEMFSEDRDRKPAPVPETQALDTSKEEGLEEQTPPTGGKFKNRISSWLKDAEEDATKAEKYLDKKRERQANGVKPDAIVDKTDVIKAMETIETASSNPPVRRKTPPSDEIDRKKQLIRDLGRKPSEEKVSLYVRKPSVVPEEEPSDVAKSFLNSMAKKSSEVPTDFLNTIDEESKKDKKPLGKKYPFNRTTTPNSLREALRETLVKNLGSNDLSDTIQSIKDDEIKDTFDIDNENIETPPMQRRGLRPKSMRLPNKDEDDNISEAGSDFGNRRKNHKFRTLGGDGNKPLGDRELMLKKNRASNVDVSKAEQEEELGLFDRFSTARKSISKGSVRRKMDEDTMSLNDLNLEKKSVKADWRARLANRFKKGDQNYDIQEAESRKHSQDETYRKLSDDLPSAPHTEPVRRRTLNLPTSTSNGSVSNAKVIRPRQSNTLHMRKSSNSGEYDSEMINGKYVTSVPIMSPVEEFGDDNLRPKYRKDQSQPTNRGLRDLKKPLAQKNSLVDRLSGTSTVKTDARRATSGNVYDRLNNKSNLTGSRNSINGSRRSLASVTADSEHQKRGTLSRIKDLTKNLRKSSREEESRVIAPRDSRNLFTERKPMSSLNRNGGSRSSINSSSRSLNRTESNSKSSPKTVRRSTLNIGETNRSTSRSVPSRALGSSGSLRSPATSSNNINRKGLNSSKENLSRSSSSTSNSLSNNDLTRSATSNGPNSHANAAPSKTSTASIRLANPSSSSSSRGGGLSPSSTSTSSPLKSRKATHASASLSFMKPTASSVKKLSASVVEDTRSSPVRRPQKMSTPIISRNTRR